MSTLVDFESIGHHFESLTDPRHERNRKHLLVDIIIISIAGILCGCPGPTAIHRWASAQREWLARYLQLPNGIPSRDCLRRVLLTLKPTAFQQCFREWIQDALAVDETKGPRLIAVDGKTCRGSQDGAKNLGALHVVSAWASEEGIALGQVATEEKSNEITAIPELIAQIDVAKAIVTIDAMGCQKAIIATIVAGGGDAVIAVKDNQPKLKDAVAEHFRERLENSYEDLHYHAYETRDQGHGRIDERCYYLVPLPKHFGPKSDWPHIKAIGYAMRWTTQPDGKETSEVRYYISTRRLTPKRFAEAVRGHWSIESMHWTLDVTMREDDSRTRERTLANNLSWLRRFAVTLLKRHPLHDSLRGKMQRCSFSAQFLTEVLMMKET